MTEHEYSLLYVFSVLLLEVWRIFAIGKSELRAFLTYNQKIDVFLEVFLSIAGSYVYTMLVINLVAMYPHSIKKKLEPY